MSFPGILHASQWNTTWLLPDGDRSYMLGHTLITVVKEAVSSGIYTVASPYLMNLILWQNKWHACPQH